MPVINPLDDDLWRRLEAAATEMKSDKFWRDLAAPIDKALRHLRDELEAFDSVSAKEYRKQALAALGDCKVELDKAADANMFVAEAALVDAALAQLRGDEDADAAKQKAAVEAENKYVPPKRGGDTAAATTGWDEATAQKARETPFTWEADDEGAVNVRIAVPPETGKGDVTVAFAAQHLKVAVKDHPLQPHVIDAPLLYGIKSGECSWALEGKGAKRCLALNLEKRDPEADWAALLADEAGLKKKGLQDLAQGIEGVGLKAYGSE